jgi:hypothetical protein
MDGAAAQTREMKTDRMKQAAQVRMRALPSARDAPAPCAWEASVSSAEVQPTSSDMPVTLVKESASAAPACCSAPRWATLAMLMAVMEN